MLLNAASLAMIGAGSALLAQASPVKRADLDTVILSYALTLEHLESAFYSEALAKYDAAAFRSAGYPDFVRTRIAQIGQHEAQHVALLSGALGASATKACTYSFPYTSVESFLGLSAVIENVGVGAYLGAADKITSKDYLDVAASILTVEARHQSWVAAAALKGSPSPGAFDTPLTSFSQVYSIAAAFIKSCPESNPTLPVKAFPTASVKESTYTAGDTVTLAYNSTSTTQTNLIIYSGLASSVVAIQDGMKATLPASLQGAGTAYGILTTASNATEVSDDNTVAGPIIFSFPRSSTA